MVEVLVCFPYTHVTYEIVKRLHIDGSIMAWSSVEMTYIANEGLDEIVEFQRPFALSHDVSFGDL